METKDNATIFSTKIIDTEDGPAFVEVISSFENYDRKQDQPFLVLFQQEVIEPNEADHPEAAEIEDLNEIEADIMEFLFKTQTVHLVARVAIDGWRDSLFYINEPSFDKRSLTKILDDINEDRGVNFSVEEDPEWEAVGELF